MSKITKVQGQQLKGMMKEDAWDTVIKLLAIFIEEDNAQEITGNNEFETLRALHRHQGRVEGLTTFFDKLERGAFDTLD